MRPHPNHDRAFRYAACGIAAMVAFFAASQRDPPLPPHIVFVMIDALRARNLGCYGYARPTSPSIDRLAQDAVLFEQAISVGGNTTTSVPGVFTGRSAFFEYGEPWTEAPFGLERFREKAGGIGLPEGMTTLAEYLGSAGYQTAGFITNPYLKAAFSMHRGFGHYEEIFSNQTGVSYARAEKVLRRTLRYLGTVDWKQPTFLYLHFMDTHGPYREPEPALLGDLPGPFRRARHDEVWDSWQKLTNVGKAGHEFDLQYMTASYDSGIRHVDDAVGRVLQYYRDRGLFEKTLFVITADHGEEFLEHGGTLHKGTLFEELVHVPLVVRAPGGLRRIRSPRLVRNFDIAPTLLDYAGIRRPAAAMEARSFRPLLEGRPFDGPTTAYAGFPGIRMMRTDRYKLLRRQDGSELFYDLEKDPQEMTSLAPSLDAGTQSAYLGLARAMDRTVQELRRQGVRKGSPPEAVTVDAATRGQLRALGYLQ